MRLRGGTAGILAAIAAGRLDPCDPLLPEEKRPASRLNSADRRQRARRQARRAKRLAARLPF